MPARKLTDSQAAEILRLFNGKGAIEVVKRYPGYDFDCIEFISPDTIARRYGVAHSCIYDLIHGHTYKNVRGPRRVRS